MYEHIFTALALTTILPQAGCAMNDPSEPTIRALLVVSNHGELGDTGQETGVWMAELTHPYWALADSDLDVTIDIASPDGGDAPIDAFSVYFNFEDFAREGVVDSGEPGNDRFLASPETGHWIAVEGEGESKRHRFVNTLRLRDLDYQDYDVVYFAGGNGAMWQFPDNEDVHRFIREMYEADRSVAAACHGTATLLNATLSDGSYLVEGKRVTGFSTAEEIYMMQDQIMPLLIQDVFEERGAVYVEAEAWMRNVVVDGRLITGQNPPSAEGVGEAIIAGLRARQGGK